MVTIEESRSRSLGCFTVSHDTVLVGGCDGNHAENKRSHTFS